MFQHVLNDIVAVLICGQRQCSAQNLPSDAVLDISNGAVLQHSLNHSAAVWMGGQLTHVALDILQSNTWSSVMQVNEWEFGTSMQ